ncbi:extensin family protein [Roseovarius sp. 2305UL8-3]|uniref:extensin-like domain-containing protein n=1 Tax=Roseovarius conchicola TaxID=3121636 RepID=UPI003527955B
MRHLFKALFAVALIAVIAAVFHPETPLPDEWNPTTPLRVDAPVTSLTGWKLRAALEDDAQCLAILEDAATFQALPPLEDSEKCFINPRVSLSKVGPVSLAPVETRCQTALRVAMWERHGLQAAARRHMQADVREIRHFSSYSCRRMRTASGDQSRMSTHATADALDVSGFVLANGVTVDLKRDWPGSGPGAAFLRDAFEASCLWFPVALGPEFNALHADHFHLQTRGWGLCR